MIDFDFNLKQQKEVMRLAFLYKREAKKCYFAKAYLSGCILMGAAMEALLLSTINCFPELILGAKTAPKIKGKIKPLEKWGLGKLIEVAEELNWLPPNLLPKDKWAIADIKAGDYFEVVQKIRNLIHPARYAKELGRRRITKKHLIACFNIADNASNYLFKALKNYILILKEEKERRTAN